MKNLLNLIRKWGRKPKDGTWPFTPKGYAEEELKYISKKTF